MAEQIHKMLLRTGIACFKTVFYKLNSKDKSRPEKEKADVILYNPVISDSPDFKSLINTSYDLPIIILSDLEDEMLAVRLIKEGVQD